MGISHQLEAHGGSYKECQKCVEVPDEPLRKNEFPEEPCTSQLCDVLASVIGVEQLDGGMEPRMLAVEDSVQAVLGFVDHIMHCPDLLQSHVMRYTLAQAINSQAALQTTPSRTSRQRP